MDMKKFLQAVDNVESKAPLDNEMKKFISTVKETKKLPTVSTTGIQKYVDLINEEVNIERNTRVQKLTEKLRKGMVHTGSGHNLKKDLSHSHKLRKKTKKSGSHGAKHYLKYLRETDQADTVTLDIPLMIRLLEYAKEDAQDDMALHRVAEQLINLSKDTEVLSMEQYDAIVSEQELLPAPDTVSEVKQRLDPKCWKDYKKVGTKIKGGVRVNNCKKK